MNWIPKKKGERIIYKCDGYTIQIKSMRWSLAYPDGTSASFGTFATAALAAQADADSRQG